MKFITFVTFLLVGLLLVAPNSFAQNGNQSFDARAIFKPSSKVAEKISGCANTSCAVSIMQKAGASRQAIAFTTQAGGYMTLFRKMGKVDLAEYIFFPPTMYNDGGTLLINGTPQIIFADDTTKYLRNIDIKKDPLYPSLVRKFHDIDDWVFFSGVGFETMQKLPGGGQRFIFGANIQNGCHACDVAGVAHVAFDFDTKGNFLGTKLIRLSKLSQRTKK